MFNSTFNVYKIEWLDLVFNNRNKSYGAYVLRAQSNAILVKSLMVSSALFVLLFVSPLAYSKLFPDEVIVPPIVTPVDLNPVHQMKKPEEKKIEQPKAAPAASNFKTVNLSSNIVVVDEPKTPPPTVNEIKDAVVGNKTQEGEINPYGTPSEGLKVSGGGEGKGDEGNATAGSEEIIENLGVDEYPEFAGGMKAFTKYIQRNLRYPDAAQEVGVAGKVFISFVVEKDGTISNVTLVRGIGYGCDEEAVKIIKKSPLWKPGKNKGIPVRVRYNVPINFTIAN